METPAEVTTGSPITGSAVETLAEVTAGSPITRSAAAILGTVIDKIIHPQMIFNKIRSSKDANQSGKVRLNLAATGTFDKSKVSSLSSGTLTETGIEWDDISKIPNKVTYDYDISNTYQLSNQKMHVELSIKGAPTQEEPVTPSDSPAQSVPEGSPVPSVPEGSPVPSVPEGSPVPILPDDSPAPSPLVSSQPPVPSVNPDDDPPAPVPLITSQPTVSKVSSVKKVKTKALKKAIQVSWKKLSDVSGYELQYSTDKSFKKAKKAELSGNKTKYTIKKLKKTKKYYIRICAYKTYKNADGKTERAYGKYTKVTAKTK